MSCGLTELQLEVVKHLANGLRPEEIAEKMHRSRSNVEKKITASRRKLGANTNAHLVSIVIASGDLVWTDDNERAVITV